MYLMGVVAAIGLAIVYLASVLGSTTVVGGHTGPVYVADGTETQSFRQEAHGAMVTQPAGGKYKEAVKRGKVYSAQTAATGVAPGTALGTTVPFALYNPAGSGVNLIMQKISMEVVSGTFTAGFVAVTSSNPGDAVPTGTAITPRPRLIGAGSASVALPFTTATITTNAAKQIGLLCSINKQVTDTLTGVPSMAAEKDFEGEIVVQPGFALHLCGTTSGAGTSPLVVFNVTWEEEAIAA